MAHTNKHKLKNGCNVQIHAWNHAHTKLYITNSLWWEILIRKMIRHKRVITIVDVKKGVTWKSPIQLYINCIDKGWTHGLLFNQTILYIDISFIWGFHCAGIDKKYWYEIT